MFPPHRKSHASDENTHDNDAIADEKRSHRTFPYCNDDERHSVAMATVPISPTMKAAGIPQSSLAIETTTTAKMKSRTHLKNARFTSHSARTSFDTEKETSSLDFCRIHHEESELPNPNPNLESQFLSMERSLQPQNEEEDRRRRRRKKTVQVVFFLLGVGVLLPWNAFISAKSYFQTRMCDLGDISDRIEAWFSVLYNGASVVSLAVVLVVQFFWDPLQTADDGVDRDEEIREEDVELRIEGEFEDSFLRSSSSTPTKPKPSASLSHNTIYYGLVMIPLGIYFAVFILTTISVAMMNLPTQGLVWFTLGGFFLCGVCTSVSTSGVVGTAGLFDPQVGINPYFHGQAAGGLLVAIGNFIASTLESPEEYWNDNCSIDPNRPGTFIKLLQDGDDDGRSDSADCPGYMHVSWSTAAYFAASCLILLVCMVGYAYVESNKQSLWRQESNLSEATEATTTTDTTAALKHQLESSPLLVDRSNNHDYTQTFEPRSESWAESTSSYNEDNEVLPLMSENSSTTTVRTVCSDNSLELGGSDCRSHSTTLRVWRSVQGPAIALFWNYFVTLAIFPVWTSELSSIHQCEPGSSRIRNDLFSPLSFVVFNVGDLAGRLLSSSGAPSISAEHQSQRLVLASIARFAFFPLFLVCAASNTGFESWVVPSDAVSWAIQFWFAVSNGYLTNLAFGLSPSLVENRSHPQQVASAILNFSLCLGLLCGSLFSFPFLSLATGEY